MHLSKPVRAYLVAVCMGSLAACGSSPKTTTVVSADGNNTAAEGNTALSNATLTNQASSSKMAKQSSSSVEEHADLSETATTGEDDGDGTRNAPRGPSPAFGFAATGNLNLGAFDASMQFRGNKGGRGALNGNARVQVAPRPMPPMGHMDDGNLSMVLTLDTNLTLKNGDVISIVTEPNLTITKSGRRQAGTVTRTLNGTVHRTLVSAKDGNDNFDLVITHEGTQVVDTYVSNKLASRVTNGNTTVVNNVSGEVAEVKFNGLLRDKPSACLCPSGGSVSLRVTAKDMSVTEHTYDFTGACGTSTVDVTGNASAMLAAGSSKVMGSGDAQAAGAAVANPNSTVSSSAQAHVHGELSWQDCIPEATTD